ncbi:GntR family transcriptional regulator [Phreatobacter aquaticus]|uniref:GntR family transcriptional regulator n=1 Tax=Phreatobacter aquaticus TaxID=2570229 RepID=A0A4D7QM51_9HYPH|nr:GntR family transcriptional regulator [Phreatobacter aquaticus]QCK86719.1 GntR family transcriptional regulator [Phreatobacter aquaticus]
MAVDRDGGEGGVEAVGFRPLYRQVKDRLVRRIAEGRWLAGQMIPSEMQIAQELAVSQGTVRKALDEMTAENLLVRRQGRGTYVASHDDDRVLFQFFKLTRDDSPRAFPDSEVLSVVKVRADAEARARLMLAPNASVVVIRRLRSLGGERAISEEIIVPSSRFPGLEGEDPVPNNLYGLYAERYGVTVARATESLKAIGCPAADGLHLGLAEGTPVLRIDRVAADLDGHPVEWRVSLCRSDNYHYLSDLR